MRSRSTQETPAHSRGSAISAAADRFDGFDFPVRMASQEMKRAGFELTSEARHGQLVPSAGLELRDRFARGDGSDIEDDTVRIARLERARP